jgi:PAS domain S-box-containing protein
LINLIKSLEGAADGAFAIDNKYKIVYWNRAAEELLGYEKKQIIGRFCYQVLQGLDEQHRLLCTAHCPIAKAAFDDEPVANYDIQARKKMGDRRWLNMSIFAYREREEEEKTFVFHLFRDVTKRKDDEALLKRVLEAARRYHDPSHLSFLDSETNSPLDVLTPRENEVLTYLAKGYGTNDIAQALFIAPNTVRNHVQNILQKLQVHSRAEAVAYAIKYGLVD